MKIKKDDILVNKNQDFEKYLNSWPIIKIISEETDIVSGEILNVLELGLSGFNRLNFFTQDSIDKNYRHIQEKEMKLIKLALIK